MGSHDLRHGRGIRGELLRSPLPAHISPLPGHLTRQEEFERRAAQLFNDIRRRAAGALDHVELAAGFLPPDPPSAAGRHAQPPVAQAFPADTAHRATVVAYRAPLLNTPDDETGALLEFELATAATGLCALTVDDLLG